MSDGIEGGGSRGYLFASNERTESVYQFSCNRAEWLWSVWSVQELFFQNAVHIVQTTESSKETNIYSSANKRYDYMFLSFHRCKDISGS